MKKMIMMKINRFSLIELLIVTAILGALSALILPMFHDSEKEAKDAVVRSQMRDIQKAFGYFYADLLPDLSKHDIDGAEKTNFYLQDIALYGLWPLFSQNHPVLSQGSDWGNGTFKRYASYNHNTKFGWRGQYLEYNGTAQIAAPSLTYSCTLNGDELTVTSAGAQSPGYDCRIPVLRDPYGGYYRVLCPEPRVNDGNNLPLTKRLKRMVIVCTGQNRRLDTTSSSFIDKNDSSYIKSINSDDISARGDDTVMRLLPAIY